jgi:hypothetical protein
LILISIMFHCAWFTSMISLLSPPLPINTNAVSKYTIASLGSWAPEERHYDERYTFQKFSCSVDRASRYNSCIWPTWCTILFLYVYFNSLHVLSNLVLIIRRINCINTISGMCHSETSEWSKITNVVP